MILLVNGMTAKQYQTNLFFPTPLWRVNIKEELSQKNLRFDAKLVYFDIISCVILGFTFL